MKYDNLLGFYFKYKEMYLQKESGSLYDNSLSSDLKDQYHYGSFILASVLAHNEKPLDSILKDIMLVLDFMGDYINNPTAIASIDFNIEALCLAHWICEDNNIKVQIEIKLKYFEAYLNIEINAHATDYHTLRYFNIKYFNKYFGCDISISTSTLSVIENLLEAPDILFDSYTTTKEGVPDITYHCRNLQIFQMCVVILEERKFTPSVLSGLLILDVICNKKGDIGFYGRSPETIYGYSSLLLALSTYKTKNTLIDFEYIANTICKKFISSECDEIEITIGGKFNNNQRYGYDSYMYPIVYKLFGLSRCMLAFHFYNTFNKIERKNCLDEFKIFYSPSSGFVKINSKYNTLFFNIIGHTDSLLRPNDPRYLPCVANSFEHKSGFIAPYVPFRSCCKLSDETILTKLNRKIRTFFHKFDSYSVGFHPIFILQNAEYRIEKNTVIERGEDFISACTTIISKRNRGIKKIFNNFETSNVTNLSILSNIRLEEGRVSFFYEVNKSCLIEYSIRINVKDTLSFKGKNVFINNKLLMSFSLVIDKIISRKLLKCTGGIAVVVVFSFATIINKFRVVY